MQVCWRSCTRRRVLSLLVVGKMKSYAPQRSHRAQMSHDPLQVQKTHFKSQQSHWATSGRATSHPDDSTHPSIVTFSRIASWRI